MSRNRPKASEGEHDARFTKTADDVEAANRRDFLYYTTTAAGTVAAGAAVWSLADSMNPSADVISQSTIAVDLTGVQLGSRITVKWAGKPVFIWRRTPETVAKARATPLDDLPDPIDDSEGNPNINEPLPALDANRATDEAGEWLIVISICTHLGCVPIGQDGSSVGEFGGWFCPCHGSHYDLSGRIRKGPAPRNLDIPPYSLGSDLLLKVGIA
ncbi:ubiquinol-cytochrome c reductase iron-sulfur subunit [Roseovarius indicus]|uniref:Ubiquinol-cytochrome c reductase iron-sulfur subunit n=1 Tax=Roseovarius indicus TaxID=540747 RepID=A0A5P3ANG4_9RHOB|nr:ubiquinol-cytochrome c reductase iron-sulfur subunit [Roseovarius indicus]QEW29825.1 Ubiquinol-cytochrome c reductase iron-sulfur subunit [Roseovarius indicus]SFE86623.1 ubiquinol-cytochrome c reductase iron-sulfur subunit [Roseovarius indicus]